MIIKRTPKKNYVIPIMIALLTFLIGVRITSLAAYKNQGKWSLDIISEAADITNIKIPFILNRKSIFTGFFMAAFSWMCYETVRSKNKKNMQENTYGSADWNSNEAIKALQSKEYWENQIFTKTESISKDMSISKLNRNIVVIGRPGTGKTRYMLKPNILSSNNETLILTDPKGELLRDCGTALQNAGFEIKVLNLVEKWKSDGYNPFKYIKKLPKEAWLLDINNDKSFSDELKDDEKKEHFAEDDVMSFIHKLMTSTKSDTIESQTGDPFWEKAEMVFLQAIFYYVIFNYDLKDRNFKTVLELIRLGNPDKDGNSDLKLMFDAWGAKDPNNVGVKQWKHFILSASSPKMMATIILTAVGRLAPFNIGEVERLTSVDTIEIDRIGLPGSKGKVAYFIITEPGDNTFNFIANMAYTQIFNMIDYNAKQNGGTLATPCNIYMDEWAQLGEIPRFIEMWAYVRSLDVGITIFLQSLSQLKKMYKESWETALDCCDFVLFLGSRSKDTLEYMSTILGKQTLYKKSSGRTYSRQDSTSWNWDVVGRELATIDEISRMEKGKGILSIAGMQPFYSDLYDLSQHPRYDELFEPWIEKKGEKDLQFRETKEWIENHAKLYVQVSPRHSSSIEMKHQKLMDQLGIKAKVNTSLEMKKICDIDKKILSTKGDIYTSKSTFTDELLS